MYNRAEQIWDAVWQSGASGRVITSLREGYSSLLRNIIQEHLPSEGRVLELGCGTATLLLSLSSEISEGVGLDVSEQALHIARANQARRQTKNISFVKADCMRHDFEQKFDLVWSAGLIEHFFNEDIDVVQRHLSALKPGGVAIMSVPYKFSLHGLHYLLTRPRLTRGLWPWSRERYFQKFYSRRSLRRLGARVDASSQVYFLRPWPIGLLLGILVLEVHRV